MDKNKDYTINILDNHEKYMLRCLELGKRGLGKTSPNPMVGSVIVRKGKIIGEGFHKVYGKEHAEVNAIDSVQDKKLLKESTLYVNLEPCAHQGQTPPCSDLIIEMKIPHVVIGTVDPHSLVAGKGIEKLEKAGVKVEKNILEQECLELNKRFFTYHSKRRPYIILKWAQSADGYIDILRDEDTPKSPYWITNQISKKLVHKWRSQEQAIMVGTNTVLNDNPSLTTREWPGPSPLRIVLDKNLRLPNSLKVFQPETGSLIFNSIKNSTKGEIEYCKCNFDDTLLVTINEYLFNLKIVSVIIEGGKQLLESFIEQNLWDEARVFTGEKRFERGLPAPIIQRPPYQVFSVANDQLSIYKNS